jgi:phosphate transport system protein
MLRKTFETELQEIKDEILVLGSMVEDAVLVSMKALKDRNTGVSKLIYEKDRAINQKRYAIESKVMIAIATQQPMARDLRLLASILDVVSELERMGDYAKGIANINLRIGDQPIRISPDLSRMAEKAVNMLHRALTAFIDSDETLARQIPSEDDEVDALYNQVYRVMMTYVMENPKYIEHANFMIWAAHNLERMADRVTNICERTVFVVSGEIKEIETSDDEQRQTQ